MPTTHDVSSLVAEAAADRPDMLAVVEAGGRSITWSGLEDEVARIATGLGAAGLVAGQRVLLALGNRIEFVDVLPRGAAGAGGRRTGEPAGDSGRAGPDGSRLRLPGPGGRRGHRRHRARGPGAAAGRHGRCAGGRWRARRRPAGAGVRAAGLRRGCRARGRRAAVRRAAGRRGPAGAAAARPGEAGLPALHERDLGPAACSDAHSPSPAGQHRPGRRGRAADDPRRRRRARGAPALPRLRPERRARRGPAPPGEAGAGRAVRARGDARPDRRRGRERAAGGTAGVRLLAAGGPPARAARARSG